mgnify:CR=1 FL=1
MKKGAIISISVIAFILALIAILFGAGFCLRSQTVTVLGDKAISISKEEIISSTGLKNGQSIFLIDKEKVISNIEAKHAEIKVIQIKTTGLTSIEICVRARHEMFYTIYNGKYYIMDEELKVLEIKEIETEEGVNPIPQLTHIKDNSLNINNSTLKCDFVGNEFQQQAAYNLNQAMQNNVKEVLENNEKVYYTRTDFVDMFKYVEFEMFKSFNKIIITTKHGVKFDIENPSIDLTGKLNICLASVNALIKEGENRVICTPVEIASIVAAGHTVLVEKDAGVGSGFPDEKYAAAGAKICDTAKELWDTCDFLAKVKEIEPSEYKYLKENQKIF